LSSHGSGWREFKVIEPSPAPPIAAPEIVRSAELALAALNEAEEEEPPPEDRGGSDDDEIPPPPKFLPEGVFGSPNRSVNGDDNSLGDALYNAELAKALKDGMGGRPFELIAFDACLMGMVEIAFGMRNVGGVLVSSEELVHSAGFNHSDWLRKLRENPAIDGPALGKLLVRSYDVAQTRRIDPQRTLSAFDLGTANELSHAISNLSDVLIDNVQTQRKAIRDARKSCTIYAFNGCDMGRRSCFFHVDLKRFTDELGSRTQGELRDAALRVSDVLRRGMIDNYAGSGRQGSYGSAGLAIYFPDNRSDFLYDALAQKAYFKINQDNPVEFVQRDGWADFLHVYHLGVREAQPCAR
jgi:hypothetical protein